MSSTDRTCVNDNYFEDFKPIFVLMRKPAYTFIVRQCCFNGQLSVLLIRNVFP